MPKLFANNINLGNKTLKTSKSAFGDNDLITKNVLPEPTKEVIDFFYKGMVFPGSSVVLFFSSDINLKKIFLRCGEGYGTLELRSGEDGSSLLGGVFSVGTSRSLYFIDELIFSGWPLYLEVFTVEGIFIKDLSISLQE